MAGSSLTYRILGDPSSAIHAMRRTRDEVDKSTKGIRSSFKKLAGLSAGISLAGFAKSAIDEARESQKVNAQTGAVLKSTGQAAGVSAKHVGSLATSISNYAGIDDEAIQSGENLLLTFTGIRNGVGKTNDVFDQATKASTDMAVAMGQDVKTAALQVGKALNDPIKGVSKLTKVGVVFTQQQKDQITAMVKAGDVAGAQKVILRELQKEFGGSAAAQATAADKAGVAWKNLEEQVGTAAIPALDSLASVLSDDVVPALSATFGFLDRHKTEVKIVAGAVLGLWGAWKGYTIVRAASQWFTTAGARYRQFVAELSDGNRTQRAASTSLQGVAAGASQIGKLVSVVGPILAVGAGLSQLVDRGDNVITEMHSFKGAVAGFRDELQATNGALTDNVRLSVAKQLQDRGLADRASAAHISLSDLTTGVTGTDAAFAGLIARWKASGAPADETIAKVKLLHIEFGIGRDAAKDLTGVTKQHTTAEQQQKAAIDATTKAIRKQKTDMDALLQSILAASGNKIAAAQAELQFRDGLAAAKQEVKDNGKALDANTTKGRANREWLLEQVDAINGVANAQSAAKVPAKEVAARWAENVRQLRAAAIAAGLNKTQVDNLVGSMTAAARRKFRLKLDADLSSAQRKLRDWKQYWEALRITLHASVTTGTKVSDPRLGDGNGHWRGTDAAPAGWAWVGERGPELMRFKGGEQVLSHPNSVALAGAGGYAQGTTSLAALAAAGAVNVRVFIGNEEIRDIARVEIDNHASHRATLGRMHRGHPS